jgi:WhiB family redox-sensing transcriptional regulator
MIVRSALTFSPGAAGPLFAAEDRDALSWQDQALCAQADPEEFFPERGGSTREAKRVCRSCPVAAECLEFALANDERFGVWGGLSERERRRVKPVAIARCRKGLHVMTPENTLSSGHCRTCKQAAERQRRAARARKALAA